MFSRAHAWHNGHQSSHDATLRSRILTATAAVALYASGASAGPSTDAGWRLDSFGTMGFVHSDYEHADFVTDSYAHSAGVGHTESWSAKQDTKLGLQLTAPLTDRLTAVVQVLSKLRYDDTFSPAFEWANLNYDVTSQWNVRAGRVLAPTYLTSEADNVGFANLWIRTPREISVLMPVTFIDGVDTSYSFDTGDTVHRVQLMYGDNRATLPGDIAFENTGIKAAVYTLEYDALTLHAAYEKMQYIYAPKDDLNPDQLDFDCYELGVVYDPGRWYVTGEMFFSDDEEIGRAESWYVGGGYRIGSITAYAAAATIEQVSIGSAELSPVFDQQTKMLGLRWDFRSNFDFKLQFERTTVGSVIIGTSFINFQPGAKVGDRANVISAAIDFVW